MSSESSVRACTAAWSATLQQKMGGGQKQQIAESLGWAACWWLLLLLLQVWVACVILSALALLCNMLAAPSTEPQ